MSLLKNPPNRKLIGHRGFKVKENTLSAFDYAIQNGLNWIEIDIRLNKNRNWILMHDDNILRTNGKNIYVKDLTNRDIEDNNQTSFTQINNLRETLNYFFIKKVNCIIEIKEEYKNLCELDIKKLYLIVNGCCKRKIEVIFTSYDISVLKTINNFQKNFNIRYDIGYNIDKFEKNILNDMKRVGKFYCLNCCGEDIKSEDIVYIKENSNYKIGIFTINTQDEIDKFLDLKVDYIFTDCPELN